MSDRKSSSGHTEHGSTRKTFDLASVHMCFVKSQLENREIDLKFYCDGWRELSRFLDTLGTLFHFVTQDVMSKLEILEAYLKTSPDKYKTVNGMLQHEVDHKIAKSKKPSGSRTLLRLHRALDYILTLFEKLANSHSDAKVSSLSHEAYSHTLGKFHPWIVRKAAGLAMYSLPHRGVLLHRIDPSENGEERVSQLLGDIVQSGKPVYDITESLYTQLKLHDLP